MKKIIVFILFLFVELSATNWYTSTVSAGNASGDSWANKKILSGFNWAQVTPGDVVYVDGGTDSLVYNIASFAPTTHGTALLPIIITKGVDASHNGTPVFLDNNGGVLVTISNITYTTIQYLKFKGKTSTNGDCWLIDFSGSPHDVTFQYCTIDLNWSGGISCEEDANSYNIKFLHNTITEWMNVSGYSTDLFWLGGSNNHDWELGWNTLIHKNPQTGGGAHRDMIQFAWSFQGVGGTTKIHHNYFDNRSAGTAGACIESHSIGGNYEIYDNVFKSNAIGLNGTGSWSMVSLTANRVYDAENGIPAITGIVSLKLYNNTFYTTTAANSMLFVRGFNNVDVRNNIFYAPAGVDDWGYFIGTDKYTQNHTQLWDYNQYYFSGGSYLIAESCDDAQGVPCGGDLYTFAQWRAAGHDAHSTFNTNTPDFVNPSGTTATDYALQVGSDGIDDGTNISSVPDGYSGTARPQGSAFDQGAFEYFNQSLNAPAAPTSLTATMVSQTQINLSWTDNATDETGFKIERRLPPSTTWVEIATVGSNIISYNNTGLTANTNYCYQVRAYNTGGNSAYSNEACTTTSPNLPAAPTTLIATTVSQTQINLSWTDNASDETGFKIERRLPPSTTWVEIAMIGSNISSYNNTGLTVNTNYCYQVRAYNTGGNSAYSNEACTTTSPNAFVRPKIKVFLQGPYNNNSMNSDLANAGVIPLQQPYNKSPWNYSGNEIVTSIPSGIVDWILLELRTGTGASTIVSRRAALLKSDGRVFDTDGTEGVRFDNLTQGNYYVVVRHRNHLAIMSANLIFISNSSSQYDFTSSPSIAYGSDAVADLDNGVYGMYAGDADGNGVVNDLDYGNVGNNIFNSGYLQADLDLNQIVNVLDYGYIYKSITKTSKVP